MPAVRVVLASRNAGKVRELGALLAGLGLELVGLDAFGELPDVVEDRDTFRGNALKKAEEVASATGRPTLADDSGLEVDALGGRPGVLSARYAGEPSDDVANNHKLLRELAGTPDAQRTARFRCVLALVDPTGALADEPVFAEGTLEGRIGTAPRGGGGFGYDPLFVLPDGRTTAELDPADKNAISHRGQAARRMRELLAERLGPR